MTLGLVVEGEAEYRAVPVLLRAAGINPGASMVFRGQGVQCSVETLVRSKLLTCTRAQLLRGHSRVLVIVDREVRTDCPGDFAQRVQSEICGQLRDKYPNDPDPPVSVICADRSLENWLVADPAGIAGHAYIQKDIRSRVGNNADGRDALSILQWAYGRNRYYHKKKDAPHLAARVRVNRQDVRQRSRSLDKLLREASA